MSSTNKNARNVRKVKTGNTEPKAQNKHTTGQAGKLTKTQNEHTPIEAGEVQTDTGKAAGTGSATPAGASGEKIPVKKSTVEAARNNLQKAPAVLGRTFTALAKSKDAEPLRDLFSDMEKWTGEKKNLLYKSTILLSLISYAAALPEYLAVNELKPSIFAFTEQKEDETGRQTSEAEKFIEYMTARTGEAAALPPGPAMLPQKHLMPHDLLTMNLNDILNAGKQTANIPFNGETIPAPICATSSVIGEINGVKVLGEYGTAEKLATAALITLYQNGYRAFTLSQLCREVSGNPDLNPSESEKAEAAKWIDELNRIQVEYDLTEWARAYYNDPKIEDFQLHTHYLLSTATVKAKRNGQPVELTFFKEKPLILEYASLTNQIWEIDQKHRDIKKITANGNISKSRVRLDGDRLAMIDRLLYRICLYKDMREPAEKNYKSYVAARRRNKLPVKKTVEDFESHYNEILFEDVFKWAGIDPDKLDSKQIQRHMNFIEDCFKFWKVSGLVSDYEIIQGERKNSRRGIKFYL